MKDLRQDLASMSADRVSSVTEGKEQNIQTTVMSQEHKT